MIMTKEYENDFGGGKFYVAESTLIKKMATGFTREEALNGLKQVIRANMKVDLFAPKIK